MKSFQKPIPLDQNTNNNMPDQHPPTSAPPSSNTPDQWPSPVPTSATYGLPGEQTRADQEYAPAANNAPAHSASTVLTPPKPEQGNTTPQTPEVVNGHLILHRSEHFYLRTAYRSGQSPKPLRKPTGRTQTMPKVLPHQQKRVAEGETRILPRVSPINPLKQGRFPIPTWLEATCVIIALIGSFIAHAINIFNFPGYKLDEGTYMSSAWAILHGQITPYAYGYGHPPLAWIQIAGWIQLTGGFFTFGNALNSGRVLMIFYATGCSLLVYQIARRMSGNRSLGMLALVLFSFTPLSLTYQRQVLLDNVAIFWLLLSLYLLVVGNSRLPFIVSSALCFGIAFLSKEVMILFLPGMLYAVWLHTTTFQRKFAMIAFTYTSIAMCSAFVLMAILKGELFPYSWHLPWDTHSHLSMLQTFLDQGEPGQSEGSLKTSWEAWLNSDQLFMLAGLATVVFNLIIGWWYRKQLLVSLLTISYWLLLIRGGVVLSFYLIPLIPLTAINAAMALNTLATWLVKVVRFDFIRVVLLLGIAAAIIPYDLHTAGAVYTQHSTVVQTDAMNWVRNNVPRNDFVIINSYLYTDMHEPGGEAVGDGPTFPYANIYINVATDPQLYNGVLQGNWDRIDYIVADSDMLTYIKGFSATSTDSGHILRQALDHSVLCAHFKASEYSNQSSINIYKVQHKLPPPTAALPSHNVDVGIADIRTDTGGKTLLMI